MARKRAKKKHRGIKDPYKQQEARFEKIKNKINSKPSNEKSQEISKKLQFISNYQKMTKEEKKDFNENKRNVTSIQKPKGKTKDGQPLMDTAMFVDLEDDQYGMDRQLKMLPRIVQKPDESDKKFFGRVMQASQEVMNEHKFEEKFNVDIQRNINGAITNIRNRRLLDDPTLSDKVRTKLESREKLKKEKKKERDYKRKHKTQKEKDYDEFNDFKDEVEFGEVVYEPPSLDTARFSKMANVGEKKKSFLFMQKLTGSKSDKPSSDMTESRKTMMEEQRLKAVEAYRTMKAEKYKEKNKTLSYG